MDRDFPLPFVPAPTRRRYAGWSVERQQAFIRCLAETGSVTQSAKTVGMTRESAYRLRARPGSEKFGAAWDAALSRAGQQLLAVAIDRALNGTVHQYRKDGYLVAERTAPSDRLLIWAVNRLAPAPARPATAETIEQAIAAITQDDPAETAADYSLNLADEMGERGDAIHAAKEGSLGLASNIRHLLQSSAQAVDSR